MPSKSAIGNPYPPGIVITERNVPFFRRAVSLGQFIEDIHSGVIPVFPDDEIGSDAAFHAVMQSLILVAVIIKSLICLTVVARYYCIDYALGCLACVFFL